MRIGCKQAIPKEETSEHEKTCGLTDQERNGN